MNEEQKAHELWTKIISALHDTPMELATIKQDGIKGVWFMVKVSNGDLLISNARINSPSSSLTIERRISEAEFSRTYPYYFRWQNYESCVRQEAMRSASQNTSYIFSLISHFG